MKLNMGCGFNKRKGYVNVDVSPGCEPDVLCDVENTPWIWDDDAAEEVVFNHSLEHIGGNPEVFLAMMQEIYRICRNQACVHITVPHPRHDNFIADPTHVRAITPQMLSLFSKRLNHEWQARGCSNTPLALRLDVDFEVESAVYMLEEPYRSLCQSGQMSEDELNTVVRERYNVVSEIRIMLRVNK